MLQLCTSFLSQTRATSKIAVISSEVLQQKMFQSNYLDTPVPHLAKQCLSVQKSASVKHQCIF